MLHECGDGSVPVLLRQSINATRLGRPEESTAHVTKALKLDPTLNVQMWRASSIQSDPKIVDREVADLIDAGLPEK